MQSTEFNFEKADAQASITELIQANKCNRIGTSLIMIKNQPCKVTFYAEHGTGKHGSCKCQFIGKDIFTSKQVTYTYDSADMVQKPIVTKTEYVCSHV